MKDSGSLLSLSLILLFVPFIASAQWVQIGALCGPIVRSIAASDTNLYAGTSTGVFVSTNGGGSWIANYSGLTYTQVLSLTVSGTSLLAGTFDGGVWRRPLSEMITPVPLPSAEVPSISSLEQNYPNPFNPTTVVSYQLPVASNVKLAIFDALGRKVTVLVNERKPAGQYEVKFDGAGLSTGVYIYRLMVGQFVQCRKMVPIK